MLLKKYLTSIIFYSKRYISSLSCEEICKNYYLTKITSESGIKVGKQYINYITSGHGPHHVLLLPGGISTSLHSFHPQISGFDKDKFTLVGWDSPGYFKSTPPGPDYADNSTEREADLAYEFMKHLGINYYSVLGFCAGSILAMILAAKHSEVVNKLVLCSAKARQTDLTEKAIYDCRDKSFCCIMKCVVSNYENVKAYKKQVSERYRRITEHNKRNNNDICSKYLKDIKSPTFILHGSKDRHTSEEQLKELLKGIENSRAHIYDGGHIFHMEYPEDVNKRIQKFLVTDC